MAGRHAHMTCFVCRQVGHSAKDCPTIRPDTDREGSTTTTTKTNTETAAVAVVGICYRCGSRKHNLTRCRQPAQPDNPSVYLTRHVSCALEVSTSQVRVRRIMARACIRTEARVNYVEKRRFWPGTAPFAK